MNPTFLIFIAGQARPYDFPRVDGFKHTTEFQDLSYDGGRFGDRYVYLGRALTAEEFNAAAARIFAPGFHGEDRVFQPYVIDPEAEAKIEAARQAAAEAAAAAEEARIEAEAAAAEAAAAAEEERLAAERAAAEEAAAQRQAESDAETAAAVAAAAERDAARLAFEAEQKKQQDAAADGDKPPVETPKETPAETTAVPSKKPDASGIKFRLEGKRIFVGSTDVAGLFGASKQLRVLAAYADLKPAIETWLATLTPSTP